MPEFPPTPSRGSGAAAVYLRFAVTWADDGSREPQGLFHAAGKLDNAGVFTPDELDRLAETEGWFNHNLPAPRRVDARAVFWFKSDARECLSRIWEHVRLLREHGVTVLMMRSSRPGRILYEDNLQIAAVPHSDAAIRPRKF